MDNEPQNLLDEFGIEAFDKDLLGGQPPVPVDREKIDSFFNNELQGVDRDHVAMLLANYRVWYDAAIEVIRDRKSEQE